MNIKLYIDLAAASAKRDMEDIRTHCLGAVGIRSDGAIVRSRNGSAQMKIMEAHAESRLCQKLDYCATVFVCRVRKDGSYGLARPCKSCRFYLKLKRVKRVYYTTNIQNEFACWDPMRGDLPDEV